MAAFLITIAVTIGATNISTVLSVAASGGKQQVVRRADRMPQAGVLTATLTEWVAGFYASQFGQPAWLGQLEAGDFRLTVNCPRTMVTTGVKDAVVAGIAAGKPAPVVTVTTPAPEEKKTRRTSKKAEKPSA